MRLPASWATDNEHLVSEAMLANDKLVCLALWHGEPLARLAGRCLRLVRSKDPRQSRSLKVWDLHKCMSCGHAVVVL